MQTTADERLDEAADHIQKAAQALAEVIVNRCSGAEEYGKEYIEKVEDVLLALVGMRRILDR